MSNKPSYFFVQADIFKPDELLAKVNAAIKEGYVPCGGLVQLDNPYHTGAQIAQAVFRLDPNHILNPHRSTAEKAPIELYNATTKHNEESK